MVQGQGYEETENEGKEILLSSSGTHCLQFRCGKKLKYHSDYFRFR